MSAFVWKMNEHSVGDKESHLAVGLTVLLRHESLDSCSTAVPANQVSWSDCIFTGDLNVYCSRVPVIIKSILIFYNFSAISYNFLYCFTFIS